MTQDTYQEDHGQDSSDKKESQVDAITSGASIGLKLSFFLARVSIVKMPVVSAGSNKSQCLC